MRILTLATLLSTPTFAQFFLEQSYSDAFMYYRPLAQNGDAYVAVNQAAPSLSLYDENHALITELIPQPPAGETAEFFQIYDEDLGNPDAAIEIAYRAQNQSGDFTGYVQHEDGTLLASYPFTNRLQFLSLDTGRYLAVEYYDVATGLPDTFGVYDLADFSHVATLPAGQMLGPRWFDQSGVKVCVFDETTGTVLIYNTDFTLWKSFSLTLGVNESMFTLDVFTEQIADSDTLLELGFVVEDGGVYEFRFQKEDGTVLISGPSYNLRILNVGTSDFKLLAINPGTGASEVYDIATGSIEFTFAGGFSLDVYDLPVSGKKWAAYDRVTREYFVYNLDYTLWKSDYLSTNSGDLLLRMEVTEDVFDSDTEIEIMFSFYGGNGISGVRVQKENGSVWGEYMGGADAVQLVYLQELQQYRLITFYDDGFSSASHVVSWVDPSSIEETVELTTVSTYPNPAQTSITIESDVEWERLFVYDQAGRELLTMGSNAPSKQGHLNVENLAAGLYTLVLEGAEISATTKFLVAH